MHALILEIHQLLARVYPLRAMTPPAPQRTSLEEHGRSYARSIVYGVPLNVEYQSKATVLYFIHLS
ncbi:hypothetical protein HMPREF1705_04763 [Acetomicrobium hydrogeniformans ATCC BAA-1850]|uniref:Uncharacterized protein n=1 Tax=Acetomicrobium hydrogeniformans ATCC BAA-1850 TaxID=592015 RepID=A0A0T5XB64_9BACT|nr:hypothetical protein HMPREF1705_04763 [Acetomicrobium hydrogeniformans ATCC BAA-1850]